ncbi:LptF/LptG family permease [Phormidium sp. LEGE 05292]|nr:LptF/LptG family permease [Phormidium sp. LEGE 05292]
MDRYLLTELLAPFLFGVGLFSSVGVTIGALFDLMRKISDSGLAPTVALKIFLLQLPYFIAFALPASMLLATLITYSRLSSDSELIALRSFGIHIYRLLIPAVCLGIVVTGLCFWLNELVVPAAKYEATQTLQFALNRPARKDFQERNIIYPEYNKITLKDGRRVDAMTRLFYAEEFDGERMKGLTVLEQSRSERAGVSGIVVSESAVWNQAENTWDFYNGTTYLVAPDGSYQHIVRFEHQQLQLPRAPLDLARKSRDYAEMNIAEALEQLKLIRLSQDTKKIRKLEIRIHQKIALPFSCLIFGLLGSILGIRPQRTSKATGFGISVLIILAYYLLMTLGDVFGLSGILPPEIAGWLPNIFGVAMGSWLLWRLAR